MLIAFVCLISVERSVSPTAPLSFSASRAEALATEWWSQFFRGWVSDGDYGAAWRMEIRPGEMLCYVGVCEGKIPFPSKGGDVVGGSGGYYNLQWVAKHRAPDGNYYKNARWFGKGKTWEDAFFDACQGGYPPMQGREPDHAKEARFLRRIGKPLRSQW